MNIFNQMELPGKLSNLDKKIYVIRGESFPEFIGQYSPKICSRRQEGLMKRLDFHLSRTLSIRWQLVKPTSGDGGKRHTDNFDVE